MYQIGLSTCGKTISEELFAAYRSAGIDAMEISVARDQYDQLDYAMLDILAKRYGIKLWSFHLPFSPFSRIDLSSASLAKDTVAYYAELIKKGTAIGIDQFIVHPSGEPIDAEDRVERMRQAKESLASLAELAASYGAVIAVEDLPRTCLGNHSDEIKELLSAHPKLKVCFDTNHLLTEDPIDFIHKLGDKIITTHISDYDRINERHWLPGEGCLNWNRILQAFREINYQGVWMYEIGFACPNTIVRNRALTCEDFVNNAREIFAHQKITVFSTPVENLGM